MRDVIIAGAGAQARIACDIFTRFGIARVIGFLDLNNNREYWGKEIEGRKVLGPVEDLRDHATPGETGVFIGCADLKQKFELISTITSQGYDFVSAIHPHASIAQSATIGEGVMIEAPGFVQPSATVGDHVVLYGATGVLHDTVIAPCTTVGTNAQVGAWVKMGSRIRSFISSTIVSHLTIGDDVIIGAGSTVMSDVEPGCTVVGTPARVIRRSGQPG